MASGSIKIPKAHHIYEATFTTDDFNITMIANQCCVTVSVLEPTAKPVTAHTNWTNLGTLPEAVRPKALTVIKLYTPDTDMLFATLQIQTNGVLRYQTPQITSNVWLQASGVYAL